MVIGGGGTSAPSNQLFYSPLQCRVIRRGTVTTPQADRSKSVGPTPCPMVDT